MSEPPAPEAHPHASAEVTVLTHNVNFARAGDARTLDALAGAGADVLLLQETNAAWEAALRERLGAAWPHAHFRPCGQSGGLGVLSRWPVEEAAYLPALPGAWWPAWRLRCASPLGVLQVLHVHLFAPMEHDGRSTLRGYLASRRIRAAEMAQHAAALEPGLPTLVAGDFNENVHGRALRLLARRGLHSVLQRGEVTWRWPARWLHVRAQLDHVVHDASLAPVRVRVLDAGGSDHLPVVATFRRAGARS